MTILRYAHVKQIKALKIFTFDLCTAGIKVFYLADLKWSADRFQELLNSLLFSLSDLTAMKHLIT